MSIKPLDISVIIPFKNHLDLTLACVKSLLRYSPPLKEVLLVSNYSSKKSLDEIHAFTDKTENVTVIEYNKPFNYQVVNNWAARKCRGKFLFFLNNDTEFVPESKGLIEMMVKQAAEHSTGVVGCLLLYGDKSYIQHAGVFLVSGGLADHLYVGEKYSKILAVSGHDTKYPYSIRESRPMTAVTAASIIVERKKFEAVNGFDERFILCGGDVDLCIRLNKAGFQTWFVSDGAKFILHKESQSRAFKPVPFNDFYHSYLSYSTAYDDKLGDKFLPKICELKEIK